MLDYKKLMATLECKEPVWQALDDVYNSVNGDAKEKSLEVTELVAKFITHQIITSSLDLNDRNAVKLKAMKMISRVNEDYPFNTDVCLKNIITGCATTAQLLNPAIDIDSIDDVLTTLIRGQSLSNPAPATESLKDKVINGVKSIFNKEEKAKKPEKSAKPEKPEPKEKPSKEVSDGTEDDTPNPEDVGTDANHGDEPEVNPPTSTREELPEIPKLTSATTEIPDESVLPEPVVNQVQAHRVAWQVLLTHYKDTE